MRVFAAALIDLCLAVIQQRKLCHAKAEAGMRIPRTQPHRLLECADRVLPFTLALQDNREAQLTVEVIRLEVQERPILELALGGTVRGVERVAEIKQGFGKAGRSPQGAPATDDRSIK